MDLNKKPSFPKQLFFDIFCFYLFHLITPNSDDKTIFFHTKMLRKIVFASLDEVICGEK